MMYKFLKWPLNGSNEIKNANVWNLLKFGEHLNFIVKIISDLRVKPQGQQLTPWWAKKSEQASLSISNKWSSSWIKLGFFQCRRTSYSVYVKPCLLCIRCIGALERTLLGTQLNHFFFVLICLLLFLDYALCCKPPFTFMISFACVTVLYNHYHQHYYYRIVNFETAYHFKGCLSI